MSTYLPSLLRVGRWTALVGVTFFLMSGHAFAQRQLRGQGMGGGPPGLLLPKPSINLLDNGSLFTQQNNMPGLPNKAPFIYIATLPLGDRLGFYGYQYDPDLIPNVGINVPMGAGGMNQPQPQPQPFPPPIQGANFARQYYRQQMMAAYYQTYMRQMMMMAAYNQAGYGQGNYGYNGFGTTGYGYPSYNNSNMVGGFNGVGNVAVPAGNNGPAFGAGFGNVGGGF